MTTIKDVAREAGVSVTTVSRVWNGSGTVRQATRDHVQAVAARLHYTPHAGARSLITSRTSTIGVLLPDLYDEFFSEVIRGIDQTARRHGYHVLLSSSHADSQELDAAVRSMRGRVDGFLVMSPDRHAVDAVRSLPDGFPIVLLNSLADDTAFDLLTVANFDGARAMTRHLIAHGHDRVAVISGPPHNTDAEERLRGYRAALREAGHRPSASLEADGDFSESSGYLAMVELLGRDPRATAVFAANDAMAVGALGALHDGGLDVPGDMALAGFDDIPMARYLNPPLSSVHVDIAALGQRAAVRLFAVLLGEQSTGRWREELPATLEIRTSCGGLPPPLHSARTAGARRARERPPPPSTERVAESRTSSKVTAGLTPRRRQDS